MNDKVIVSDSLRDKIMGMVPDVTLSDPEVIGLIYQSMINQPFQKDDGQFTGGISCEKFKQGESTFEFMIDDGTFVELNVFHKKPYLKMYIAVRDDFPDFMVPTLVAHSVLNAHIEFLDNEVYQEWFSKSFRKVVIGVNAKEFARIGGLDLPKHFGHENNTLGGAKSCIVVLPVMSDNVPNALKYAKTWAPK